ncbi:MAG: O-antigen ligase family protein [Solirubrobacterales bacterium]|nr:O-antigen ligase family protein [Solirubrobacterales bacterium]MBV9681263.1 O-antigen ligase family protein [Solirubrobacterales bacterium]
MLPYGAWSAPPLVLGALSGPLPKLGVVAVALLAAAVMLHREVRFQALTMLGALVLAPVLLLSDIWHSPQLSVVHRHPLVAAVGSLLALGAVLAAALVLRRRPALVAGAILLALPFRIPIHAGGTTSNLLVPLYFVVAAGSLAFVLDGLRSPAAAGPASGGITCEPPVPASDRWTDAPPARWLERLLAAYIVLYAMQATYSPKFEKALQQMVFFYVPFALAYCLLRRIDWTPRLTRMCVGLLAGLALLFALVGFVEYATKTIFLNPSLIAANSVHTYFTVNSVFFDPNIFGRFLALVMVLLGAVLLYARRERTQLATLGVLAILWGGLVLTLSRSSLGALLVGLAALAALRWQVRRAVLAAAVVVAAAAAAIAVSPTTFGLNQGLNGASSGRPGLVSGGIDLFGARPLWGYGSGSFETEYTARHHQPGQTLSASHTIPITIAAEQGLIGELVYVALVVAALVTLLHRARADPARVAVAAAFIALAFHTLLYADFLEDPIAWTLLAVGVALARRSPEPRTADSVLGRDRPLEQQLA